MQCAFPIELYGGINKHFVPCGQCMPCRINKKRMVTGRILLENQYSAKPSTFLTLTYDDDNLPDRGSLIPADVMGFINRLRQRKEIRQDGNPRYFAVGEYGDHSWRPHYHLALFGVPPEHEDVFQSVWSRGFSYVGEITRQSAGYIAGYTTKKMTTYQDPRLIDLGLVPEFTRMSKFPPLGAGGFKNILDNLMTRVGSIAIQEHGDVPSSYRFDGKTYPIDPFWKAWLREQIGIESPPVYQPWVYDLEEFNRRVENAKKTHDKLYAQNKRRKKTSSSI